MRAVLGGKSLEVRVSAAGNRLSSLSTLVSMHAVKVVPFPLLCTDLSEGLSPMPKPEHVAFTSVMAVQGLSGLFDLPSSSGHPWCRQLQILVLSFLGR